MKLHFIEENGTYVAFATAQNVFNLHIQREQNGDFKIFQRASSDGIYLESELGIQVTKDFSYSFDTGYYPMELKFISSTPVTIGLFNCKL